MLTMRGGPQVASPGVKMGRPPPVPPRPDKSVVADALAKSRKVPAPILPPGLKKDASPESPRAPDAPPSPDKAPSPRLNGLSRVKSFIRDVINDKKHSEDKKPPSPSANSKEAEAVIKNGTVKSHIPVSQSQQSIKAKPKGSMSFNYPTEESVKNHSSQSVVRSLCSVLINSEKKPDPVTKERVKIIKSNSFAEKAVPVRRAPPPPISPKPGKKFIEEKLARSRDASVESPSVRKLSASCEELNNSTPRPVVYQSPNLNKSASPVLQKKSVPPNLPPGKPTSLKKRSAPSSPSAPIAANPFPAAPNSDPVEFKTEKEPSDPKAMRAAEMLISEIVAAKNEAAASRLSEGIEISIRTSVVNGNDAAGSERTEENIKIQTYGDANSTRVNGVDCKSISSDESCSVKCVTYGSANAKSPNDDASVCSGESGGRTVLFINNDAFAEATNPILKEGIVEVKTGDRKHLDDEASRELLIEELQSMRREEAGRRRLTSSDRGTSSPDSASETQNIQHSDWMHVEDNGERVRYSSCQIVIEDAMPVDDSGICLDDHFYSSDNLSNSLSPSLVSRLKEQFYANQKMSSLQGLPPLPKSLSGFNVSEGEEGPPAPPGPPPVPARGPDSLRCVGSPASPPTPGSAVNGGSSSSSGDVHRHLRKPTTLDTQLALLKREMLSLRQLDLSLLSQLWSLNESIHEFRQYMNERSNGSGVPEDDDDMEDEADDSSSGGEDAPRLHQHVHRGRTPV